MLDKKDGVLGQSLCREKSEFYVNKEEMIQELRKRKETGIISDKLGKMLLDIAKKFTSKPCFAGYTFKDDIIGDVVVRMIQKIDKFDLDRPGRLEPFSYFTQIAYHQILNTIGKEKRQRETKKNYQELIWSEFCSDENIEAGITRENSD